LVGVKDAGLGTAKKMASEIFTIFGLIDDSKISKEQFMNG